MYKYENIVLPYIEGKYTINDKGELIACCPFHHEENPSFNFNLEKGLYHCHSCGESGNITQFISKVENVDTKTAYKLINQGEFSNSTYTLEDYAKEKKLDLDKLKLWGLSNGYNCIHIPYYDENNNLVATRLRHDPKDNSKPRFSWKKGSKISLYGLNGLDDIQSNEFIVVVEGESDTMTLY